MKQPSIYTLKILSWMDNKQVFFFLQISIMKVVHRKCECERDVKSKWFGLEQTEKIV
jgi:hypothetical protein